MNGDLDGGESTGSLTDVDRYSVVSEYKEVPSAPEHHWFYTEKVADRIYLTTENHFYENNRCNIWLLKGPSIDVVIDCGLGVCDLKRHLVRERLIDDPYDKGARKVKVLLTHIHWDHSGGARHFHDVSINEAEHEALRAGRSRDTLNYVKPRHFLQTPYAGFDAKQYRVAPTICSKLRDQQCIDIGGGEHILAFSLPGHSTGSMVFYWPQQRALFSGDTVYAVNNGAEFIDWLPSSNTKDYINSSNRLLDFLEQKIIDNIYPGHSRILKSPEVVDLLNQYVEYQENNNRNCCRSTPSCCCGYTIMKKATQFYLSSGLYKYLPWELPF